MPISPTNSSKHVISPDNVKKSGIALWGDNDFTWGDDLAFWGDAYTVSNSSKHVISPSNLTKN